MDGIAEGIITRTYMNILKDHHIGCVKTTWNYKC